MMKRFGHIEFQDPQAAERCLTTLLEGGRPRLADTLADALAAAADPNRALLRMEQYLESCLNPRLELDLMDASPTLVRMMATLFDQSAFLTEIVRRNPEYMTWLIEEADLDRARNVEDTLEELLRQTRAFDSFAARTASMRRYFRREILRIGVRDLFRHAPVASVTEDLSNLADAMLETALESAIDELTARYGISMESGEAIRTSFTVLAMGKLGGRELNFSSDIDLLFVYSDEGETTGGGHGRISNAEYFQKLGELIIKALAEQTVEGRIFRIDMRLRPHGRTGPLASTLRGCIDYYERYGQAWERQALIKSRPAAGSRELGARFIELTRPFVFPRTFDDETLEDICETRRQMEAQISSRHQTEREVKRGRGGIRDIEFTVQMLQMLNGGRRLELRTTNTLEAIEALGRLDLLSAFEASTLASNYTFLRMVEHRLQIEESQQLHLLPEEGPALDDFARRIGFHNGESFMADYRDRTRATREILERFLATEGPGRLWLSDLLNPRSNGEASLHRLAEYGFHNVEKARAELLLLSGGPPGRPHSLHVRQRFAAVAPKLLEALKRCADADQTLLRFSQIVANVRASGVIYDLLRWNPDLSASLAVLIENSNYLTQLIIQEPGLFEMLGRQDALQSPTSKKQLQAELAQLQQAYEPDAAMARFHRGEMLRIGMRELIAGADVVEIGQELTHVAEVCLDLATWLARERAAERYGPAQAAFGVLGLGKMGGAELGYGSDLDLVFVYDGNGYIESGMQPAEYFANVAGNVIRILKEPSQHGRTYDVDARLRPDGNKGELCVSAARFIEYYTEAAAPWERLALVKIRAVSGDAQLVDRLEAEGRRLAFALPLTAEVLTEIEDLRARLAAQAQPLDLKKSEGGIAELEFTVRLLQLRHARENPELQRGDVLGAITLLRRIKALKPTDAEALSSAYRVFRRIENRLRVMEGRATSTVPSSPEAQADLAKRLGLPENLSELIKKRKRRVHAVYERVLDTLSAAAV